MKRTTEVLLGIFLALILFNSQALAKGSGMPDSDEDMPQLKAKGVYTATGKEDWSKTTGFRGDSGMVDMMNQMMVGGSGMENMRMNMNMQGTSEPSSSSKKMADDSTMNGMDMGDTKKKLSPLPNQAPVSIQAVLKEGEPRVGKMTLVITALDPVTGNPMEKLKVSAKVFMTSMDMGTERPKVEEVGKGQYQVKTTFSMAGPWRVELTIVLPGNKSLVKNLDFDVQMPE